LESVTFLDYLDGSLPRVDAREATSRIAEQILLVRPQVVLTFAHDGFYGHPDHIAISQFTTAAVTQAAARGYSVPKLYYVAWPRSKWDAYQAALKELVSRVGNQIRRAQPWPDWALTTVLDTRETWQTVWQAVSAHRSQVDGYRTLKDLPQHLHRALWGTQFFYRALSLVNGGPAVETDLFEGIR
jgi:LmbE family N-acetylglucosaminyl deacetylase